MGEVHYLCACSGVCLGAGGESPFPGSSVLLRPGKRGFTFATGSGRIDGGGGYQGSEMCCKEPP